MRNLPNMISILRILLALTLPFLKPFSSMFWTIYFICGFSDIMDGYIARRTNSISKLGTKLDSIADLALLAAVTTVLVTMLSIPMGIFIWILVIVFIRIVSLLLVYFKYRAFAILHTYANKVTGLLLFCSPFLYDIVDLKILQYIICIIATVSSIEELIINIKSQELERNTKGMFMI